MGPSSCLSFPVSWPARLVKRRGAVKDSSIPNLKIQRSQTQGQADAGTRHEDIVSAHIFPQKTVPPQTGRHTQNSVYAVGRVAHRPM